jgi:hypothetical protein
MRDSRFAYFGTRRAAVNWLLTVGLGIVMLGVIGVYGTPIIRNALNLEKMMKELLRLILLQAVGVLIMKTKDGCLHQILGMVQVIFSAIWVL